MWGGDYLREIGGYFEMEENQGNEYHEKAIALNSGRNALAYLVEAAGYHKVYVPDFACDSISKGIRKGGADVEIYEISRNLRPSFKGMVAKDEAILIINYYGQIDNHEIELYKEKWGNVIVDNTHAFFQRPVSGIDTIYSCRKFFGVADGAYLYTDVRIERELEKDISAERMLFVWGRYDENASKYYKLSAENNECFDEMPVKFMSKVTHNILKGIDYERCAIKRYENACYLHEILGGFNALDTIITYGAFMYPLYLPRFDTKMLRAYFHNKAIYVPCLWPDVVEHRNSAWGIELSTKIIPIPCDQRYSQDDMKYIVDSFKRYVKIKEHANYEK